MPQGIADAINGGLMHAYLEEGDHSGIEIRIARVRWPRELMQFGRAETRPSFLRGLA